MTVPTRNDHLNQARANRDHAEWLIATAPTDPTALQWAVTSIVYGALHWMTAYLMGHGLSPKTHTARAQAMLSLANVIPASILYDYRMLDDLSRGARYDLWVFTVQDVRDLLDQELAAIATFAGM